MAGIVLFPLAFAAALVAATAAASSPAAPFNVSTLAFDEGFAPLFGDGNLVRSAPDGRSVRLLLDRYTGSGFISCAMYQHGLFSASIKLPSDYTAGVVVAFYTSNGNVFEKNHDELDFEFLGNIHGKEWRVQTNVYGNGSTSRGREERYFLPFDPTAAFHRYSILWTSQNIVFYVDDTPIREVRRSAAMGGDYPSKPMSLYATIWDASSWATSGGAYKVNYAYAPFAADYTDLALLGCLAEPIQQSPAAGDCSIAEVELAATGLADITPERHRAMHAFRARYMSYSFCYDKLRYPEPFPDCDIVESEKARFKENGHANAVNLKKSQSQGQGQGLAGRGRRVKRRPSRVQRGRSSYSSKGQADM